MRFAERRSENRQRADRGGEADTISQPVCLPESLPDRLLIGETDGQTLATHGLPECNDTCDHHRIHTQSDLMRIMDQQLRALHQLAHLSGVQTEYYDVTGHLCQASPEILVKLLQLLGLDLPDFDAAPRLRDELLDLRSKRMLEPVSVAWQGKTSAVTCTFPTGTSAAHCNCRLVFENGQEHDWQVPLADCEQLPGEFDVAGVARFRIRLPDGLPAGYHHLQVGCGAETARTFVISSPVKAFGGRVDLFPRREWGLFVPLYSIHSQNSWGAGDFGDLQRMLRWNQSVGGQLVGTLPFLAAFLDEPFDPSPYSPASRLFWNEMYLDISAIPELVHCPAARELIASSGFQQQLAELRSSRLVDYPRLMKLKRQVLELLSECLFQSGTSRRAELETYLQQHPRLADYAAFRATGDRQRSSWWCWPEPLRSGTLDESQYDPRDLRYHLYVQWLAEAQLRAVQEVAATTGPGLYLDLPLGVSSDSYDVWRERSCFVVNASVGSPPDPFFPKGQNWGFPPLHPECLRQNEYRYLIDYLRHHMQHAGVLRIDHMMGLSRQFWIPHGMTAREGAYVRYPADELYAIYCLESHRAETLLVGEDLGTVPPEVPEAMRRHHVRRMYVMQYEAKADPPLLPDVFPGAAASLNTHDMPTFAAFWQGADIEDRLRLHILEESGAVQARQERDQLRQALLTELRNKGRLEPDEADCAAVYRACLRHLAAGDADIMLINLEDLWGEVSPQNVPGTSHERPNWRQKLRYSLEELGQQPQIREQLEEFRENVARRVTLQRKP